MSAAIPTPQPLTSPAGLDSATLTVLVRNVLGALPTRPDDSPAEIAVLQDAAVTAALDYRPRNPREAMLAARIVMADRASAECYRLAAQPDLPHNVKQRYQAAATATGRQCAAAERALQAMQKLPAPPVLRAGSARAVIAAIFAKPQAPAAANATQHPMPSGGAAPQPAPAADATKDARHRGASAPQPVPAADATKDARHRGASAPRPAAGTDTGKHPIHRDAPTARPRSVIELPPTPQQRHSARITDEVMAMARNAAVAPAV
jgi:hypothetical protein